MKDFLECRVAVIETDDRGIAPRLQMSHIRKRKIEITTTAQEKPKVTKILILGPPFTAFRSETVRKNVMVVFVGSK